MPNKLLTLFWDVILHVFICEKKVKIVKYKVKSDYFKILRKLTSKYKSKNERIEFINKYIKQKKISNKYKVKMLLYMCILAIVIFYPIQYLTTFCRGIIYIIICILTIRSCICEIIILYNINQFYIFKNALLRLDDRNNK